MANPGLFLLFDALAVLLILAAFFAGSETALMSLNRYRLRHRAKEGSRGARLAERLLARPDRLIGLILLLRTPVHVAAPILGGFIAGAWAESFWRLSAPRCCIRAADILRGCAQDLRGSVPGAPGAARRVHLYA